MSLLREPGFPAQRDATAGRREPHPQHPDHHRAGSLRCRLPGNQRLGPASRLAGGGFSPGTGRRSFRVRSGGTSTSWWRQPIDTEAADVLPHLNGRRFWAAALLWAGFVVGAHAAGTRLLRFPDVWHDRLVFSYAGDLWTTSTEGGRASRLTAHSGLELFAKFSPDGEHIAFHRSVWRRRTGVCNPLRRRRTTAADFLCLDGTVARTVGLRQPGLWLVAGRQRHPLPLVTRWISDDRRPAVHRAPRGRRCDPTAHAGLGCGTFLAGRQTTGVLAPVARLSQRKALSGRMGQ